VVAFTAVGTADSRPSITIDPFPVNGCIITEWKINKGIEFAVETECRTSDGDVIIITPGIVVIARLVNVHL
jgi:hypothetical protein